MKNKTKKILTGLSTSMMGMGVITASAVISTGCNDDKEDDDDIDPVEPGEESNWFFYKQVEIDGVLLNAYNNSETIEDTTMQIIEILDITEYDPFNPLEVGELYISGYNFADYYEDPEHAALFDGEFLDKSNIPLGIETQTNGFKEIKNIINFAFLNNLISVDFSETNIENILVSTFCNCENLISINLNGIVSIGESAFYGCTSLGPQLIIPESISFISEYAFENCSGFDTIKILQDNPSNVEMLECVFEGWNSSGVVYLPSWTYLLEWQEKLTSAGLSLDWSLGA